MKQKHNNAVKTQQLHRIIMVTKLMNMAAVITTNTNMNTLNSANIGGLVFPEIPFPRILAVVARVPARQLSRKPCTWCWSS